VTDRGALVATPAGVPPGGMSAPGVSPLAGAGRDAGVHGGRGPRRVPNRHGGRGADACIVTAHARQGFAAPVLPRLNAWPAGRGGRLSPTQPVMPPSAPGVAC
jgi:hypothetical protein